MKDSSRAEELRRIIHERVNACGERKWMRVKRTFLVLSGVVYLLQLYHGLKSDKIDIDIESLLSWLGIAPVMAGFIMFISYGVLYYIVTESMTEEKNIARLIGKLEGIEEVKRSEEN